MRPLFLFALAMTACHSSTNPLQDMGSTLSTDLAPTNALVAARPYQYQVPSNYDPSKPTPLVILLHAYSVDGALEDLYFGFSRYADSNDILYAYPDGTKDHLGNRFWSATDACCGDLGTVDDVAYLDAVIDDMRAKFNVDDKRVFLAGHSNGAFMAHRMACDSASKIAAIVSLAGRNWLDMSRCKPTEPVAVLEVDGTADMDIQYNGGTTGGTGAPYGSARDTVAGWATRDGCSPITDTSLPPLDLDASIPGAETTIERWVQCHPGGGAELWTINGGTHIPALKPSWASLIYGFLSAHPKP